MAKLDNKSKDNPRLEQRLMADGQISLYLEFYLGRESVPVLDEDGEPVLYESGKMKGKPKYKVTHNRRKQNLNLYLVANPKTPIDRTHNKEVLLLAKKIRMEEEQKLIATHYTGENPNVRKAFILCLYCGLRFCDVKDLTFANVDYSNKLLKFEQNKTKGHSANSGVVIPLTDNLLKLIGEPTAEQTKESLIFPLPSYESCSKSLRRWVKRAGIDKHISWHCARHSFATNILTNGANIKTVASLLGHSGLKHTEKYVRAVDKLKEEAICSLPDINF